MRLLLAVLILAATPAWAGVPVAYDADYKTLKKNVFIGDPLGFELYETTDCTGTPVYSEILGAGSPQVTVEQVKPVPAKKQKPKPQTIARLRIGQRGELREHTLTQHLPMERVSR